MSAGRHGRGRKSNRAREGNLTNGSSSNRGLLDEAIVKALSHPLRIEILGVYCREGSLSPAKVSRRLGQSVSTVAYHVRVLFDECGLLELEREEPRRGATEHFYRATSRAFVAAAFNPQRVDERDLMSWLPVAVDEAGRSEVGTLLSEVLQRLAQIEKASRARMDGSDEQSMPLIVGVACLHVGVEKPPDVVDEDD